MLAAGLAPATVNRRLSALRSVVKLGRRLSLVEWAVDVEGVPSVAYRDTTGPGVPTVRSMLAELADKPTPKAAKDRALLRLMFDRGLRRGEVVALDLEDVDVDGCRVRLVGKGRTEPEWITVGAKACLELAIWVAVRGDQPGALFTNFDKTGRGDGRLTGRSVARVVAAAGLAVGATVRPHGLRHTAITAALDVSGGDVRAAARFSRHADMRTLQRYDDNRADLGGELARRVADLV